MIRQHVKLNGEDNGIVIEVGRGHYFHSKTGETRLFKNLEIATSVSNVFLNNTDNRKFFFSIGKKIIPLESCQKIGNAYQYFDDNDTILCIEETKVAKVTSIGYLVFEDGDTVRCDKKYGMNRVNELMKSVRDDLTQIFCENNQESAIRNIYNHKNKEYIIASRDTSARIHILTNSYLMDINQARKAKGDKVLIFDKQMDKFTTLFVYSTKLIDEAVKVDALGVSNNIISYLVQDMQDIYPEAKCKYVSMDLAGRNIFVEEV